MRLALVVAVAENGVIGRAGDLPWRLSGDLKWFKNVTMGKPVIMGRKTFESIGKALPGRANIVITRRADFVAPGAEVVDSVDAGLAAARAAAEAGGVDEICVIGGAEIYQATLSRADRIYLTRVRAAPDGDAYFPALEDADWRAESAGRVVSGPKNDYDADLVILDRFTA